MNIQKGNEKLVVSLSHMSFHVVASASNRSNQKALLFEFGDRQKTN
jgi:hypothetical protein